MEAHDETTRSGEATAAPDLEAVKGVFDRIVRDGMVAGVEHLLTFCHEDLELHSYAARAGGGLDGARDELLHGKDAVLAFFRGRIDSGFMIRVRMRGYEVIGDTVAARGSTRVTRPDGSFAETNLTWMFHFRDGLVDEITWEPRAGG